MDGVEVEHVCVLAMQWNEVLAGMDYGQWLTAQQVARALGYDYDRVYVALRQAYVHGIVERREVIPGSSRWEWRRL